MKYILPIVLILSLASPIVFGQIIQLEQTPKKRLEREVTILQEINWNLNAHKTKENQKYISEIIDSLEAVAEDLK